ncbi:hypothetical protein HanRHA438_Chr06g0276861 [Helianthus annuus]|nr:hypothetical protein HanRHA438_Chr06g0276861 [Helianthus annuus]
MYNFRLRFFLIISHCMIITRTRNTYLLNISSVFNKFHLRFLLFSIFIYRSLSVSTIPVQHLLMHNFRLRFFRIITHRMIIT